MRGGSSQTDAALGLAELLADGVEQQRIARAPWAGSPRRRRSSADQLEPGGDVAPLVGAAHLELDAERPVELAGSRTPAGACS